MTEIIVVVEQPPPDIVVVVEEAPAEIQVILPEIGLVGPVGPIGPAGADLQEVFSSHVISLTPHPVYDDGPSFFLLYQNAKV